MQRRLLNFSLFMLVIITAQAVIMAACVWSRPQHPLTLPSDILWIVIPGVLAFLGWHLQKLIRKNDELQRELGRRSSEENLHGDLKHRNRELMAFSQALSHDLRTPLRALRGFSEMLTELPEISADLETADYLKRIERAAQRMTAIVQGMSLLCHIDQGRMRRYPVDVSQLAEQIVECHKDAHPGLQAEIRIQTGMTLSADPNMLELALSNLLSNALKFSANRDPARVEISQSAQGVICVHDNGAGFEQKNAVKIFQPLVRCYSARDFEGSGIGLAIVKQVAERHKGTVWAESDPGENTRFYLDLCTAS